MITSSKPPALPSTSASVFFAFNFFFSGRGLGFIDDDVPDAALYEVQGEPAGGLLPH